jgi:hypothetical protein
MRTGVASAAVRPAVSRESVVAIYDLAGKRVRSFSAGAGSGDGARRVVWTGDGATGRRVANGVYIVRVTADGRAATKVPLVR